MTGWNLPPGCTDRDIDEAAGAFDEPPDEGPTELDEAYERIEQLEKAVKLLTAERDRLRIIVDEIRILADPDDPCHGPQDTWCPTCGLGRAELQRSKP